VRNFNSKNNKTSNNNEIVMEMAIAHLKTIGIDSNGLLQVILRTENPHLAMELLSGRYEQPNFAHKVMFKDGCVKTFLTYDPWEDKIGYSYERNKTKRIHVPKGTNKNDITEDNYTQFEVEWSSSGNTEPVTFTLSEIEEAFDNCYSKTWLEGTIVEKDDFIPPFPPPFNEDIF
jgi:hypothetical protein